MSPEIINSKLLLLQQVLKDLKPHVSASSSSQDTHHYEIERQVQLAVDLALAIGRRILLLNSIAGPETSRDVFLALQKLRIISPKLSHQLTAAVGLRNLLVHEYGKIDYDLFFGGLKIGFAAFVSFAGTASQFVQKKRPKNKARL